MPEDGPTGAPAHGGGSSALVSAGSDAGLTSNEARRRLLEFGANAIAEERPSSWRALASVPSLPDSCGTQPWGSGRNEGGIAVKVQEVGLSSGLQGSILTPAEQPAGASLS